MAAGECAAEMDEGGDADGVQLGQGFGTDSDDGGSNGDLDGEQEVSVNLRNHNPKGRNQWRVTCK